MRPEPVSRSLFDELSVVDADPLSSVGIPTDPVGATDEARLHLKNALGDVGHLLEVKGWRPAERDSYLRPARALLTDAGFWEHMSKGLLVLIDGVGSARAFAIGRPIGPFAQVADSYHVRPLLPTDDEVAVLVLTAGAVKAYLVSPEGVTPMDADLPRSFDDVNWFMDREAQLQSRSATRGGARTVLHGHDPRDARNEDVLRYLRAVDRHLPVAAHGDLVVLGDDRLAAAFAGVSDRAVVTPSHGGVGDPHDPVVVGRRARSVMMDLLAKRRERVHARVREIRGVGTGVDDPAVVAHLARSGLVSELFVSATADPVWGTHPPDSTAIATSGGVPGEVDLLDRALVHALRTGARVEVLDALDPPIVAVPRPGATSRVAP